MGSGLFRLSLMNVKEYHTGRMITSNYSGAYYDRETVNQLHYCNEMKVRKARYANLL